MSTKLKFNIRPNTVDDLYRLIDAAKTIRYCKEPVTLSHLGESNVYVEARYELTENPVYASALLQPIFEWIYKRNDPRSAIAIGIPFAGNMMAACLQGIHKPSDSWVGARLMRTTEKAHGGFKDVLPPPDHDKHWYFTVDNAISSGGSFLEHMHVLDKHGYRPKEISHYFLFDRGFGGVERLQAAGYNVQAAYHVPTIIKEFGKLGLWSELQVRVALQEVQSLHL